jgi:regulator of sigma E protease
MNWILTVIALGIVIFIHELGHFWMAKRAGIGVLEFAVGMGPAIWSKKVGETFYSLRVLPIGGYVKMAGLESTEDVPDELNFYKKSILDRLLTVLAGPFINIFSGWLVFVLLFTLSGKPELNPQIAQVVPNSIAAKAHIQPGDTITAVNNIPVQNVITDIVLKIRHTPNQALTLTLSRQGQTLTTTVIPEGKIPHIGITLTPVLHRYSLGDALKAGTEETWHQIQMIGTTLKQLVSGQVQVREVAGPVGIVQMANSGLDRGFIPFISIMAMISISLGVANLLPFPVLDGGHVVLLALEAILGRRLPAKVEQGLFYVGAAVLISLMILIVGNDIFQFKDRILILKGLK